MAVRKSRYQPPSEKSRKYKRSQNARRQGSTHSRSSSSLGKKSQVSSRTRQARKRQMLRNVLFTVGGLTTAIAILILFLFFVVFQQKLPAGPDQNISLTQVTPTQAAPTPQGVDMVASPVFP